MNLQKKILKAKIMEALMIGPLSEIENRIDKILRETCFHLAIKIDGQNDVYECLDCKKKLEWGTWREL